MTQVIFDYQQIGNKFLSWYEKITILSLAVNTPIGNQDSKTAL